MARNVKPGISFYRMDTGHVLNPKVRLLLNEFGSDGYYVWKCLIDYGYGKWGYYFDLKDKDLLELFATDYCRKSIKLINEVIAGCLRRGLFDKTVAELFGVLTCEMMQDVYIIATQERRKKGSELEMIQEYLLCDLSQHVTNNLIITPFQHQIGAIPPGKNSIIPGRNDKKSREKTDLGTEQKTPISEEKDQKAEKNTIPPGNNPILPGKNAIPPGKNPQTKTKTKSKIIDKESFAPAEPAPPILNRGNERQKDKDAEPHWQALVDCWFNFHKNQNLDEPSFSRADPRWLKILVQTLKKRSDKKNIDWTQENAVKALHSFLTTAFTDPWLQKHFTLKNLLDQFDPIVNRAKTNSLKPVPPQKPITESGPPPSNQPMELIRYYFGKFLENTLDPQKVDPFIYEILITRSMVPSGFCNPTPGEPMSDEQKKTAVIEFFKIQKAQNAKAS